MRGRRSLWIGLTLVVLIAAGVAVALDRTTQSTKSTTTTSSAAHLQPDSSIWPFASATIRYTNPVTATKAFATTYLGFTDPLVGTFRPTSQSRGAVSLKASSNGATTTVLLRRFGSRGSWWVVAARTPNIVVSIPSDSQSISSPVMLAGRSTAYEAVVNVQVRQAGSLVPLARNVVMGGAGLALGPFSKQIAYAAPSSNKGAVLFRTYSAKDGSVVEATVVPVTFRSVG
jgi:hypothetical protein